MKIEADREGIIGAYEPKLTGAAKTKAKTACPKASPDRKPKEINNSNPSTPTLHNHRKIMKRHLHGHGKPDSSQVLFVWIGFWRLTDIFLAFLESLSIRSPETS